MKNVKVIGSGCANCRSTVRLVEEVASARAVDIQLEKIEDMQQIMAYGVMSTPGVIIDGTLVHSGGVPARSKVEGWF